MVKILVRLVLDVQKRLFMVAQQQQPVIMMQMLILMMEVVPMLNNITIVMGIV